jgi:recombination protein RecT
MSNGTQEVAVIQKNISDQVLSKIKGFESAGLQLPANYAVDNAMKAAWLVLQDTEDRNHKKALEVCTKESIANSLLDMVLQGLSVAKKQGYFVVYGNKLEFQRSYFGTVAVAKRSGGIVGEPVANVIYEGDDFVYAIDPETGLTKIVKHDQKIENIDVSKIKGAYAIAKKQDGSSLIEIKTISQIKQAWLQSPTKGQSPAHKNFPDQMAKRTVISAVCKMVVNSSDDAWLYEGKKDEFDASPVDQRNAEISASTGNKFIEEASYEEVKPASAPSTQSETTASKEQNNAPQAKESAPVDEPGY